MLAAARTHAFTRGTHGRGQEGNPQGIPRAGREAQEDPRGMCGILSTVARVAEPPPPPPPLLGGSAPGLPILEPPASATNLKKSKKF